MPETDPLTKTPPAVMPDGMITDLITGQPVKDTEKERVRQEVARQLIFEYQIAPESMEADFAVKVEGKRKKVDIAIFEAGKDHLSETLSRAVICRPLPKVGKKSVVKIRDFTQAEKDLDELKGILIAEEGCEWGLWTNGLERFYLHKIVRRFEVRFEPYGDWPMADGTMSTPDMQAANRVLYGRYDPLSALCRQTQSVVSGRNGPRTWMGGDHCRNRARVLGEHPKAAIA